MLKTVVIIGAVLLILLLAVPLGLAMAMGPCPDCPASPASAPILCIGMLVTIALALNIGVALLRTVEDQVLGVLLVRRHDRPPRLA